MPFNLRILTMVWGKKHVDLFKRACLTSLMWPRNKAALQGATWRIVTDEEHSAELERLVYNAFDCKIEMTTIPNRPETTDATEHATTIQLLQHHMIQAAYACLEDQSKMLLAPPDTIFAEGSIENILMIGAQPGVCVAVPHLRVLPEILDVIDKPTSSEELVTKSFGNLHNSWVYSEFGHVDNLSLASGILWRDIGNGLYSVQHRLPTVYLASFIPQDFITFQRNHQFTVWDYKWPAERLIRQERQRTVGSSDLAFIAEVTEPEKNVPESIPEEVRLKLAPDHFYDDDVHNCVNRLFVSCFRGLND